VNEKYGISQSLPVYFITELIGVAMDKPGQRTAD